MIKKIFVADDDQDDWFILEDAMRQSGNSDLIDFYSGGEQLIKSLERAVALKMLPSLVVLDLNMPKLNGTETLAILKSDARYQHIPVIIYSTSVNSLEKQKCLELGAQQYVTKPTSIAESVAVASLFSSYLI